MCQLSLIKYPYIGIDIFVFRKGSLLQQIHVLLFLMMFSVLVFDRLVSFCGIVVLLTDFCEWNRSFRFQFWLLVFGHMPVFVRFFFRQISVFGFKIFSFIVKVVDSSCCLHLGFLHFLYIFWQISVLVRNFSTDFCVWARDFQFHR